MSLTEVNSGPRGFCTRQLPGATPPQPPVQPGVRVPTAVSARCPFGSPPASLVQRTPGLTSVSLTNVQGSLNGGQESVGPPAGRTPVLGSSLTPVPAATPPSWRRAHNPAPSPGCSETFSRAFQNSRHTISSLTHFNQFQAMMMMINYPLSCSGSGKPLCPPHSLHVPRRAQCLFLGLPGKLCASEFRVFQVFR